MNYQNYVKQYQQQTLAPAPSAKIWGNITEKLFNKHWYQQPLVVLQLSASAAIILLALQLGFQGFTANNLLNQQLNNYQLLVASADSFYAGTAYDTNFWELY